MREVRSLSIVLQENNCQPRIVDHDNLATKYERNKDICIPSFTHCFSTAVIEHLHCLDTET